MKHLVTLITGFLFMNFVIAQKTLIPTDQGSKMHFVIKNFGIKTGGDLSGLNGTIKFDQGNIALWSFDVTVKANTIDTDNDTRDGHLRKSEYFDAAKYPDIHMISSKITATEKPGIYLFIGNLTIKGVTKPVQFPFKVNKANEGFIFSGDFNINRRDFGVGGSSVSLSDNLKVSLSIFAK